MGQSPKVFISYSHDSPEHKRWVSEIGAKLRHNGIDAILDQWDLGPGDDITLFMERGIIESDRVLVVCTDQYVRKANAAEGGVGYERMIVTAQLVKDLGTDKFIPIIRQASGQEKTPTFLGTRVYIGFTNDSQFESEFDKLIHELHRMPIVKKPPLGKNPFAKVPSGQETSPSERLDTQLPDIADRVESAAEAYTAAVKLVRAGDVLGWRQLLKRIQPRAFKSLVQWRQNELDGQQPKSKEQIVRVVDEAVDIISPLISVALVGVESGREQFRDQKSLLDDLLNIARWNRAGYEVWIHIPYALGYVYHSLHGGISLITNQLDLALSLARVKIFAYETRYFPVWEIGELVGYSQSISGTRGGNSVEGWKYMVEAYERKCEWLAPIFGEELGYRTSLVAYYMALNIHELATEIASGHQESLNTRSEYHFAIPLTFLSEEYHITQRAVALLHNNREELTNLWTCLNVTREQMENSWGDWIQLIKNRLRRTNNARIACLDILRNFFESL